MPFQALVLVDIQNDYFPGGAVLAICKRDR